MDFAIAELKYDMGKTFIVRTSWLLNFTNKFSKTDDFLCFISTNLEDKANLECGYSIKFDGQPSLMKVFVLTLTTSIEDAENFLQGKRTKTVSKRFRDAGNTDAELKKLEAKRKRTAKKELKMHKAVAQKSNMSYFVNEVRLPSTDTSAREIPERVQTAELCTINESENISSTSIGSLYAHLVDDLMNCDAFQFDPNNFEEMSVPEEENPEVLTNPAITQVHNNDFNGPNQEDIDVDHVTNRIVVNDPVVCNPRSRVDGIDDENNTILLNFDQYVKENNELKLEFNLLTLEIVAAKKEYNEIKLENDRLNQENNSLKVDLDDANKRNMSIQRALVAADENAPRVLFIEKDGGRLYNGGVFINKTQCLVLDNAKNDRDFVNNLALAIFGKDVLMSHSITGMPSHKTKGAAKPKVKRELLQLVYDITDARARTNKTSKLTKTYINAIIGKKMTNMSASSAANKTLPLEEYRNLQ